MVFWGLQLKTGKPLPFVPPPESAHLHVSQATLAPGAPEGAKAAVKVAVEDEEFYLCSLREGALESLPLDLSFDSYAEFSLHGTEGAAVHLTGYVLQQDEDFDGDSDSDDEHECLDCDDMNLDELSDADKAKFLAFMSQQRANGQLMDESDSEEDDFDESDSEEEDDDDDVVIAAAGKPKKSKSSVVIEDITDLKPEELVAAATEAAQEAKEVVKEEDKKEAKEAAQTLLKEVLQTDRAPSKAAKLSRKAASKLEAAPLSAEINADDEDIELGEEDTDDEDEEESDEEEDESSEEETEEAPKPEIAAKANAKRKSGAEIKSDAKKQKTDIQAAEAEIKTKKQQANKAITEEGVKGKKGVKTYPNGLKIEALALGDPAGKLAKPGKKIAVRYIGKLSKTGKVFDETKGKKPFTFRLGVGEVIKGEVIIMEPGKPPQGFSSRWDQGLTNMRVGDKRRLTVPPQMGYGAAGIKGTIPGNATLLFDVELCDVLK